MKKITIISIGKFKEPFEKQFFEHYSKRIRNELSLIEIQPKKTLPTKSQKEYEAELIKSKITLGSYVISMDENGKILTSNDFASQMNDAHISHDNIFFIIGGAYGLCKSIVKNSNATISLGKMTWPHLIVRGLLAEQIYRSQCILSNHPYHKE
jgi:23S rRNA (pseudouridine1915-N3)-methyltransferase